MFMLDEATYLVLFMYIENQYIDAHISFCTLYSVSKSLFPQRIKKNTKTIRCRSLNRRVQLHIIAIFVKSVHILAWLKLTIVNI